MKNHHEEGTRLAALIAQRTSMNSHLPKEVAHEAAAYARHRRSAGASPTLIARELGVSAVTIGRWSAAAPSSRQRRARGKEKQAVKMRAVRLVDADRSKATSLVATTRDGLRIEGLTVSDLVAVLRGLG